MKNRLYILFVVIALIFGCQRNPRMVSVNMDRTARIFPDYKDITIPCNIAPLNFMVQEEGEKLVVSVKGRDMELKFKFRGNKVIFPEKKWSRMLYASRNDSLEISISVQHKGGMELFRPYKIFVSGESIDGYLVYRLLMPGFQNWNQMGIYQRSLNSFRVKTIIDSRILPGTCMNCHTFAANDPGYMVLHLRESFPGTILWQNNQIKKINTRTEKMFGAAAFPYWHPSKKYIAFSVNKVNQIFHALGPSRAAAVDMKSDIFVYDISKNEMLTSPALSAQENYETFPCFSPDGLTLYYCSAKAVKLPEKFNKIKYSLCSISFDPSTGKFGDKADTLISGPAIGKSVAIPRVSPHGRFLMFCMADYGCFPSFNPESDLYLLNLGTGKYEPLSALNSDNTESWHSWSSTGKWIVFSSKRGDGLYSKPYIAFIDTDGRPRKPFLLPQKDPAFYDAFLFSYNVPELVKSEVLINPYEIERVMKKTPGMQAESGSSH